MLSKKEEMASVKPMEDDTVTIYVWSTGLLSGLGHVSMKFSDEPNHYWSIWPKSTPAGGLTSVWPLQATLSPSLEADCMQEAIRPSADFSNLMGPDEIIPVKPDRVFIVHGLDKEKMREEFNRINNGMSSGEVCYQLLPGVKAEGLFNRALSKDTHNKEVYNCVTLTGHLLKVGGKSNLTTTPWSTPSNFANEISQLDHENSIETPIDVKEIPSIPLIERPTDAKVPSLWQRISSFWFSHRSPHPHSTHHKASETYSEPHTFEAAVQSKPSPGVSESSFAFFDNSSNPSKSRLERREEESDLNYSQRVDAMAN